MKFQIEEGLIQFLNADDQGRFAEASAPGKRDFSLNFRSGVYKQVSFADFGSKPKEGDRIYFDASGEVEKVIKKGKVDKPVIEGTKGNGTGSIKVKAHCF